MRVRQEAGWPELPFTPSANPLTAGTARRDSPGSWTTVRPTAARRGGSAGPGARTTDGPAAARREGHACLPLRSGDRAAYWSMATGWAQYVWLSGPEKINTTMRSAGVIPAASVKLPTKDTGPGVPAETLTAIPGDR